jgi:Zn-dependent protease with chaperone function
MAGPEPVNSVERPGPGAMPIVRKTFIQATMPGVKVFFITHGENHIVRGITAMNRLKTTLLFSLLTVLMVFMGNAIGGQTGMVFAFLVAAAMNFFSYWFSDKIVLKMCGAREIGSLAVAIIAPIAAMLIQIAVSRSREYLADVSGARICGNPLALANALRKLHGASRMLPMG